MSAAELMKRINNLVDAAMQNPQFGIQLEQAQNPAQLVEVALSHGCEIDLDDLATFLRSYKSNSNWVTIHNITGRSLYVANWGRFRVGHLLGLFEEHGLVRPFCNLGSNKEKNAFFRKPTKASRRNRRRKKP